MLFKQGIAMRACDRVILRGFTDFHAVYKRRLDAVGDRQKTAVFVKIGSLT